MLYKVPRPADAHIGGTPRMRERPTIGVFDSGVGGLSVLRAIRERSPGADLIYVGDHAFLPYGERSAAELRTRALRIVAALIAAGAGSVVIACNTATAAAADTLRARFDVPIIGIEPAVKPAAATTRSGVVGVLGTGGTLASARFAGLLDRFAGDVRVVTRPAPELVAAVERGTPEPPVAAAVAPLVAAGADVIVLGCTHFAFLRRAIEEAAGGGVVVIDPAAAVADHLLHHVPPTADAVGTNRFWTTGDSAWVAPAIARLWGERVALEAVILPPLDTTVLG